jgi:hypothetical protein
VIAWSLSSVICREDLQSPAVRYPTAIRCLEIVSLSLFQHLWCDSKRTRGSAQVPDARNPSRTGGRWTAEQKHASRQCTRAEVCIHPRKLYTKKCRTIEPTTKSANALGRHQLHVQIGKKDHVSSPLGCDLLEFRSVFRIDLRAERCGEDELADRCREPGPHQHRLTAFYHPRTHPARNALKGKLVTRTQYANWETPESTRNARNASTNLRRAGVPSVYARQSAEMALLVSAACACAFCAACFALGAIADRCGRGGGCECGAGTGTWRHGQRLTRGRPKDVCLFPPPSRSLPACSA